MRPEIILEIKGFIPNTMLDWEGMLASTLFLPRCNFRCPYCQNPELVLHPERLQTVTFDEVRSFLVEREGWIEGVCVTGGEPCLHDDLAGLCRTIKEMGLGVKLDTNGSLPEALEPLLDEGLVDFVAMDIKAPLEPGAYRVASGTENPELVNRVRESIALLRQRGIEREFRTTVVPIMHSPADVARIAQALEGERRYVLQHFSPRQTMDPRYAELRPFTDDDMELMRQEAARFVEEVAVRGASVGIDPGP